MDEANLWLGIVGLVLQVLVVPAIGAVMWLFTKVMRIEGRVAVLEGWREDAKKQHGEVMDALRGHNDNIQGRLQSIEEHLRDRHNTG